MRKLSQRELLMEGAIRDWSPGKGSLRKGIGSLVKGIAKKGAQAVGGLGKAIKTASERGGQTTWTDVGKGAAAGFEATGDFLTSKRAKLDKFLDELGLMPADGERSFRGKKKLAVVDVIQYDYDEAGNKTPMKNGKVETRKFKYKDNRWQRVTDKQRREHGYGVELDRSDLAEADKRHPLSGKIVKHATNKGGVTYGTVVAVTDDDYAAIKPIKGSKAPGMYGKPVDEVEESTKEEATNFYSSGSAPAAAATTVTASYSQKDLLVNSRLLCDGFASAARAIGRQRAQQRAAASAPAPAAEPAPAPATAQQPAAEPAPEPAAAAQPAEEPAEEAPTAEELYQRMLAFYDKHLDLYKGDDDISKKQREIVQGIKDKIERRGPLQNQSPEDRKEAWAKLDAMDAKEAQADQGRADETAANKQAAEKKMEEIKQASHADWAAKGMSPGEIKEKQAAIDLSDNAKKMSPEELAQFNADAVKAGNQKGVDMADSYKRVVAQIKEHPANFTTPPAFDGETGRKFTDEERERFQRVIDQYSAQRKESKEGKAHLDAMKQQAMDQMGVSPAQWDAAQQKQRAKAGNAVTQQAEGTSQKDLLRQLTLLSR